MSESKAEQIKRCTLTRKDVRKQYERRLKDLQEGLLQAHQGADEGSGALCEADQGDD
jgi:hypothetical protein